jgi:hypothetical protein
MSGKLIETTFQTGPDDDLAAVDVYEGGGGVENTYDDKRAQAIDNMDIVGASGSNSTQESFAPAGETGFDNSAFASPEAFARMAGDTSALVGYLNNLSNAAKALFNLRPSQSSVSVGSNSVKPVANIKDIKAVVNIINNLSSNNFDNKVIDKGASQQLITSAAVTASNNGIHGAYQALVKNPNLDRTVLTDSAIDAIEQTVAVGNLGIALDVSQTELMATVIEKSPAIIQAILSTPTLVDISEKDSGKVFGTFLDSFNAANPNWNKTTINNNEITDLKEYSLSRTMRDLLYSQVLSLPLTVYKGTDRTPNSSIDYELDDLTNVDIVQAIYGSDVSIETISEMSALWNSPEHQNNINNHKSSSDMYIGSLFNKLSVQESIDKHFSYINAKTNSLVYRA